MIPYHGLPITPATVAVRAISAGHAFVSARYPEQLALVLEIAQSFAVDHGGFSAWVSGEPIVDWEFYYQWIAELHRYPSFDFAVIPDVIDGTEQQNDDLIEQWPWRQTAPWVGAPVWHMHESIERLVRLAMEFPRVCIGSSGEFASVGTERWWSRMAEAMDAICDKSGRPICKIHGLRLLDVDVYSRFPFASADSTNIGRNVGIDSKWRGPYTPATKESRAQVMRDRIESHQSLVFWDRKQSPIQSAFLLVAS